MSEKRIRTKFEHVQAEIYGWTWVITWLTAIWTEDYRPQLFFTGLFCLVLGMLIVGNTEEPPKQT